MFMCYVLSELEKVVYFVSDGNLIDLFKRFSAAFYSIGNHWSNHLFRFDGNKPRKCSFQYHQGRLKIQRVRLNQDHQPLRKCINVCTERKQSLSVLKIESCRM